MKIPFLQKKDPKALLDAALAKARQEAADKPQDLRLLTKIAELYLEFGDTENAINEYLKVAKAYQGIHKNSIVVGIFRHILALDPSRIEVYHMLVEELMKDVLMGDSVDVMVQLAKYDYNHGMHYEAAQAIKKIKGIDPDNKFYNSKVEKFFEQRNLDPEAIDQIGPKNKWPFIKVKTDPADIQVEPPEGGFFNLEEVLAECQISGFIKSMPEEDAENKLTDAVHFTMTAPRAMIPGGSYIVDAWAHTEDQRQEVIKRAQEAQAQKDIRIQEKGPVPVHRKSIITAHLSIPDFIVNDSEDTIFWDGNIGNARFPVAVPPDAATGEHPGRLAFYIEGVLIAKLHCTFMVARKEAADENCMIRGANNVRSAFASYASDDRNEVLSRIQGIRKVIPDLDVFLDVSSLYSGEDWQKRLTQEIAQRDILYLFWSFAASRSEWVEREWRTALKVRGIEYIDPVPLVAPDEVPPPSELASKHFNDWTLAFMRSKTLKEHKAG